MIDTLNMSDILIVGAGATGLTAGLALARAGRSVTVVGPIQASENARTVALLDGSLRLLSNLGVLDSLRQDLAALETMRIVDDTDSLFRTPQVEFRASEIGLALFGENVENNILVHRLAHLLRRQPGVTLVDDFVHKIDILKDVGRVLTQAGRSFTARLLVAADGRNSPLRTASGITVRKWSYNQEAMTAILAHERPHRDTSTEFHTRQGPFTLVPLPPRSDAANRSSLVWLMSPTEARRRRSLDDRLLVGEIERQAHFLLGRMRLEPSRGGFGMSGMTASKLSAHRVVLIGDAAHGFPPIGAQGLNLGMRDVAYLADCLEGSDDPGAEPVLARYEELRQTDVRLRTLGVDILNRSLLTGLMPVDAMRGIGLITLANIKPLRRFVMRQGVMPGGPLPGLMRVHGANSR
jgi:2-octaprenyl-6-methoxyphenol hydroxylase